MKKGFTFVETLVAIAVLLLAVAAPLSLASRGLAAARSAQRQVTAVYLAQEAVEYVRAIRDSNSLSGQSWLQGLQPCIGGPSCRIDVPQGLVSACGAPGCPALAINASTKLYGYGGGWSETPFTRSITIDETVSNQEALVSVSVSWKDGLVARNVSVGERLFNWQ